MKYLALPKQHKWLSFFVLVLLVILGVLIYYKVSLELNRRAFQQADYAIETIYNDIVKEVGQPDDNKSSSRCGGFQGVYGEGPISCHLNASFIYPVENKQQSDQLREKIRSIVQRSTFISIPESQVDPNITGVADSDSATTKDHYKTKGGIKCTLNYTFDPTFNSGLKLKEPNNREFYTTISCGGPARAKFF